MQNGHQFSPIYHFDTEERRTFRLQPEYLLSIASAAFPAAGIMGNGGKKTKYEEKADPSKENGVRFQLPRTPFVPA
jgi:hypothetical protein